MNITHRNFYTYSSIIFSRYYAFSSWSATTIHSITDG